MKVSVLVVLPKGEGHQPVFLKTQVTAEQKGNTVGSFVEQDVKRGSIEQSDAYGDYHKTLA